MSEPAERRVPGRWYLWVLAGAAYGIAARLFIGLWPFSQPHLGNAAENVMSIAFLVVTPTVVGALVVYSWRSRNPSWLAIIFGPWAAIALMLAGSMLLALEGSICIAIISPLVFVESSVGGLMMWLLLKVVDIRRSQASALALLPLLALAFESGTPVENRHFELRDAIDIHASRERVWNEILDARDIRPEELPFSITHLIGVPRPVEGVNVMTAQGEVRFSKWERGVNFRGIVTARQAPAAISWRYDFDGHSFPAGSMDEHVAIGGAFFDLEDTSFRLEPLADGGTRLEIVAHYRLGTRVNFYAQPLSQFLGHDFIATILGLYKNRSERHS